VNDLEHKPSEKIPQESRSTPKTVQKGLRLTGFAIEDLILWPGERNRRSHRGQVSRIITYISRCKSGQRVSLESRRGTTPSRGTSAMGTWLNPDITKALVVQFQKLDHERFIRRQANPSRGLPASQLGVPLMLRGLVAVGLDLERRMFDAHLEVLGHT
jgi:hypothetical protein